MLIEEEKDLYEKIKKFSEDEIKFLIIISSFSWGFSILFIINYTYLFGIYFDLFNLFI